MQALAIGTLSLALKDHLTHNQPSGRCILNTPFIVAGCNPQVSRLVRASSPPGPQEHPESSVQVYHPFD
jgi:hypothetical protein